MVSLVKPRTDSRLKSIGVHTGHAAVTEAHPLSDRGVPMASRVQERSLWMAQKARLKD